MSEYLKASFVPFDTVHLVPLGADMNDMIREPIKAIEHGDSKIGEDSVEFKYVEFISF